MTTLALVRHAAHARVHDTLVGRLPDVHLSARGREQALGLSHRLATWPVRAVYGSPLDRALETAQPIADAHHLRVQKCEGLIDIDFGDWVGCTFPELSQLPAWRVWNSRRGTAAAPHGESMLAVQARALDALIAIRGSHRDDLVVVVSHADVIRAVLVHYLNLSMDNLLRIEVWPASVSLVRVTEHEVRVLCVNDVGDVSELLVGT